MTSLEFVEWVKQERDRRGWPDSELARRSKLNKSTLSLVFSGQKDYGEKFVVGIARAFEMDAGALLAKAGFGTGRKELSPTASELLNLFDRLTPQQQEDKLAELRTLAEKNKRARVTQAD